MAGKTIVILLVSSAWLLMAQRAVVRVDFATQVTKITEESVNTPIENGSERGERGERGLHPMWPDTELPSYGLHDLGATADGDLYGTSSPHNIRLVHYLLNTDSTISKLASIVSNWAKHRELQQTPYMFTVMLIFFVQQRGMLPPISDLQKNVAPIIVDYWNIAFESKDKKPINEKLSMLLVEFFEYYTNFEYGRDVISPYFGLPVNKEKFNDFERLSGFDLYKHNVRNNLTNPLLLNSTIIAQDLFEHNRNVAARVSDHCSWRIITAFRNAYDTFLVYDFDEFLKSILV